MNDDKIRQPMVVVRKPDGTTVRMTLDEIKKMKSISSGSKGIATASSRRPRNDDLLAEEMPATVNKAAPMTSSSRLDQVEEITQKLSFKVTSDNANRLRTIIQLRLKGIRDEEVTKESLLRKIIDGGLGLNEKQADELSALCASGVSHQAKGGAAVVNIKTLKGAKTPNNLPMSRTNEPSLPATTTPFNAFVHEKNLAPSAAPNAPFSPKRNEVPPPFKLNSEPEVKPTMRDIVPKNIETGPVDEVRYFSLTDFRRLSTNAEEAARRFRQKFLNLKDESILLYLEAKEAWLRSPLYENYLDALASALGKRKKIVSPVDKNSLQLNELKAIVELNKSLE